MTPKLRLDSDIAEFDLDPVAFKVCVIEEWSVEKTDRVMSLYRGFLQLRRNHPATLLAPTQDIDVFWHHHILDTEKYIYDCHTLFGHYVHHFPYSGVLNEEDAKQQKERFDRTYQLLRELAE